MGGILLAGRQFRVCEPPESQAICSATASSFCFFNLTTIAPQAATIQSIGAMGFLNVGVQLGLAGQSAAAGAALALSGVCAGFVVFGFRRVKVGRAGWHCSPLCFVGGGFCLVWDVGPGLGGQQCDLLCRLARPCANGMHQLLPPLCCSGWTSLRRVSRQAPGTTQIREQ